MRKEEEPTANTKQKQTLNVARNILQDKAKFSNFILHFTLVKMFYTFMTIVFANTWILYAEVPFISFFKKRKWVHCSVENKKKFIAA